MVIFAAMLLLGAVIGFVGAGGAGVMITLLTVGFNVPIHTALGTSLAAMAFTTLSGSYSHFREGNVLRRLGLAMGLSSKVRAVFDYLIEFYRPLPPLAYYTLLVLWFGIGEFSKILLLFLAAIPPLTIGAVEGVKEVSPSVIQAARSLGADSRQVFFKIILPATTPAIITSMRISLGFTYTVLVAAEIVAATEGIGWMVWEASKVMRSDIIFVGIITMGVTGIGLDACLRFAARHLLRWKRQ